MKKLHVSKPVLNKIISFTLVLALLTGIFSFTDPNQVSLIILLIPFMLIGYLIYTLINLILYALQKNHNSKLMVRLLPISLAFLVVTLLLLASLGQFTVRDALLALGFTVIFLAYASRADFLKLDS